jgi:6-phosphofructokinase 1
MTSVSGKSQYGENKCVIHSSDVDLNGKPFNFLKQKRKQWVYEDHYCNPGPIQFFDFGRDFTNETLKLKYENYNNLLKDVEIYCERIKTACRFGAEESLLKAAAYGLESINKILGILESKKED